MEEQYPVNRKYHVSVAGVNPATLLFILVTTVLYISSCTGKEDFIIGEKFVESKTNLTIVDTFKVALTTVLLDSMSTSQTEIALVGNYNDNDFGTLSSIGYFEPGFSTLNISETAIFDSAVVSLVYTGYSYGDTLTPMSISLHQLTERITLNDNVYLYNKSHFDYSDKVLGSKVFYPEPNSNDSITIRVDELGENLFGMFMNNDLNVSTSELFLDYIKGFALISDYGKAVVGFNVASTQTFLRFYYHLNTETVEEVIGSLPYGSSSSRQFNSVQNDFTCTPLVNIKGYNTPTSSTLTGNMAFLQATVGLFPKVEFPTLQDILLENRWKILKAELIFQPVKGSYDLFALPEKLCLYSTDRFNRIGNALQDASAATIYSTLVKDEIFNEETRYFFDVTSFINDELSDSFYDSEHGFYIGFTSAEINKTFERMVIECKNTQVQLRLYYLTY